MLRQIVGTIVGELVIFPVGSLIGLKVTAWYNKQEKSEKKAQLEAIAGDVTKMRAAMENVEAIARFNMEHRIRSSGFSAWVAENYKSEDEVDGECCNN
ncbi:OLC1v1027047C1 [Oldenlandia corymbosa var. corymbosa]|uniref:OLC1v1027047C1 n=1 Tax=Oldenlandia corymbosa var. corymbosa TaxID=529605 RepID=A0AAV1C992_OLDCO|nr:OLC1v1027047C1 [Oldenlandia corymbosa var. corymbosa]